MVNFKIRIFPSCRTKTPSTQPKHQPPPCQRRKYTPSPPPSNQAAHLSSCMSHVSSAFRCGSKFSNQSATEDIHRHVAAKLSEVDSPRRKIYNSAAISSVVSNENKRFQIPLLPLTPFHHRKHRRRRNVKPNKPTFITTSSTDTDRYSSGYTVDDGEEEEQPKNKILISSPRSFSTDSPTVPNHLQQAYKVKTKRVQSSHNDEGSGEVSPEWGSPARLSLFKTLMPCKLEGKMKESFAIVKRSENPYEDFKKSMMEMIVENQTYEGSDLKQLLQCLLSLNSRYHHGVIMVAFSEIWDTMFLHHPVATV